LKAGPHPTWLINSPKLSFRCARQSRSASYSIKLSQNILKEQANLVAILVIAHKPVPDFYERVSLVQCASVFVSRDIFLICPRGMDVTIYNNLLPNVVVDFIEPDWQSSYRSFNRLKILPFLYNRYKSYNYVLFYEPDAFVFCDELDKWCSLEYDYVGAPWFDGFNPKEGQGKIVGIGNGGLSLRKVSSHLRVLNTFRYITPLVENWKRRFINREFGDNIFRHVPGIIMDYTFRNNSYWRFNTYKGNEDHFWGIEAPRLFRWFNLPSIDDAIKFSFEMQPRRLFELNQKQLPFGCHAWWKYDLEFWRPYIESFGYKL
jgi:hypothetical protein